MNCKFCGAEIKNVPAFKHTKPTSCPDCNGYCNQKCEKSRAQMLSWHKEPCVSCEHNPYRKAYKYDGEKWTKKR